MRREGRSCASRPRAARARPLRPARPSSRPERRAAPTAAIVCSTVRIARPIASSSSGVFTRRKLVHERGAGAKAVESEDPAEIQDRLGPDAVADRDRAGRAEASRDSLERRKAVVGLVDDRRARPRALPEGRRPRTCAGRRRPESAARAEERPRDPAVRIRGLAEVRDLPLDARSGTRGPPTARGRGHRRPPPPSVRPAAAAVPRSRTSRRV